MTDNLPCRHCGASLAACVAAPALTMVMPDRAGRDSCCGRCVHGGTNDDMRRPDNCRWCQQGRRRAGSLYCSRLCEDFGRTTRAERKRCLRVVEEIRVRACKCSETPGGHCESCYIIGKIDDGIRS